MALFAMALALRLWGLDSKSLWVDEALTAWHSTFPLTTLWTEPITNKPPFYYGLTHLFWSPGDSVFRLRLPAALLGATSVVLAAALGAQLTGISHQVTTATAQSGLAPRPGEKSGLDSRKGAFWLASLMLVCDVNLHYSQEARHYMLLSVGYLLLALAGARWLHPVRAGSSRHDLGSLAIWGLGSLLLVHAHPVGWLYLAAGVLALTLARISHRVTTAPAVEHEHDSLFLFRPLLVSLFAMATLILWFPVGLGQASHSFDWLRQPSPLQAFYEWISVFGARHLALIGGAPLAMAACLLLMLVALGGMLSFAWRRRPAQGILLLAMLLLPPLLLWLAGLFKPVYMLRTLTPLHSLAMTGLMLAILTPSRRNIQTIGGLLLAALLISASGAYALRYQKEDWHGLTQRIADNSKASGPAASALLICENNLYYPLWFYLQDRMPPVMTLDRRRPRVWIRLAAHDRWRPLYPQMMPLKALWIIDRYRHCPPDVARMPRLLTGRPAVPDVTWQGYALTATRWRIE